MLFLVLFLVLFLLLKIPNEHHVGVWCCAVVSLVSLVSQTGGHAEDGSAGYVERDWLGLSTAPPTTKRILVECSGNGQCSEHGQCDCLEGWVGDACETLKCKFDCHGRGTCVPKLSVKGSQHGDKQYVKSV